MGLFGSFRDVRLFNAMNKELINEIIGISVDIYKSSLKDMDENLYGEAINKVYFPGVRIACMVEVDDKEYVSDEFGIDFNKTARFNFLREELRTVANLKLEIGDIIGWDDAYWEIDSKSESQYIAGKNPSTDKADGAHGGNFSVLCETHQTRKTKLNIEKIHRAYNNKLRNI